MPACAGGAQPKPGFQDLQVWVDKTQLAADVAGLIQRLSRLSWVSLAAELLDVNELCASNPDPVEPITPEDVVAQTFAFPTGGVWGHHAVIEKSIKWLRYQQFLLSCECMPPPPPSGAMCPYVNFGASLAPSQNTPPVAYDIPQSVYDTWPTTGVLPNQDWKPVWQASIATQTNPNEQHLMQWSTDQVTWHSFWEARQIALDPAGCHASLSFVQPPRMPRTGFVRLRCNSIVGWNFTGLNFCFCGLSGVAPPLPPQPPLTEVPSPPAHVCNDQDICDAINELSHRITIIAKQITEIQRFGVPFEYIRGAVHPGRELEGSIGISRLIGMQVDITSHQPGRPDLEGNPPYVWDQGWMSVMTADGMIEEKRISQTHMVWMPRLMDMAITFGYSLRPGTVATFTELQPEP